jgi:hypothetical protein
MQGPRRFLGENEVTCVCLKSLSRREQVETAGVNTADCVVGPKSTDFGEDCTCMCQGCWPQASTTLCRHQSIHISMNGQVEAG